MTGNPRKPLVEIKFPLSIIITEQAQYFPLLFLCKYKESSITERKADI